jgi:hypothetical protein
LYSPGYGADALQALRNVLKYAFGFFHGPSDFDQAKHGAEPSFQLPNSASLNNKTRAVRFAGQIVFARP